ncbi:MAG: FxsA family protein [Myxococcota bacterium]
MGKILLVLFTVVPLLETYLLFVLGQAMGFLPTVGLILLTGVVGAWLAKREGLRVYRKWREAMAQMHMPEEGVLGGLLVLAGGVLLVTPGVLTDVTGFLLLIPPTRRFIAEQIRKRMEKKLADGSVRVTAYSVGMGPEGLMGMADPVGRRPGGVIDVEGEVVEVTPSASRAKALASK